MRKHDTFVILRLIDGDTVEVQFDLDFDIYTRRKLRIARINAPEVRGGEKIAGLEAKAALALWLDTQGSGKLVITHTERDKYGRCVAEIDSEDSNLSDWMVENNFAVYKEY